MRLRLVVASVVLLSGIANALDNCYVHERGSDAWLACKEQAGQQDEVRRANNQRLQDMVNTSNTNTAGYLREYQNGQRANSYGYSGERGAPIDGETVRRLDK